MKRCPHCGSEYKDDMRFCIRDGANLAEVPSTPTPAPIDATRFESGPPADPLIGRTLAGRYEILEKLGQGGMGAVYKGRHVKMNRVTAIKVLSNELASNAEFTTRFEREAEMASTISHPNAVAIYDFGEAENGIVYLAMEFLQGESLASIMKREGSLACERVLSIVEQAAAALEAAHQLGIVHRDFKPDNIMVCKRPDGGDLVKVVDFGIAKQTRVEPQHAALTQTGFVLGTPQYMSPEQVADKPLDARSDQYSLALVAYEAIAGVLPFDGPTPQAQMVKRLTDAPRPLRQLRPDLPIPAAMEQVIMRALDRRPEARFGSVREFAAELRRATSALPGPVTAAPVHPATLPAQPVMPTPVTPVVTPYSGGAAGVTPYLSGPAGIPPYAAVPPRKKSRVGLVVGVIGGLFVLAIIGIVGVVALVAVLNSSTSTSTYRSSSGSSSNSNSRSATSNSSSSGSSSTSDPSLIAFTSPDGSFSISLPARPSASTQPTSTDVGTVDMKMFQVDRGDRAYLVMYADYPSSMNSADEDDVLNGAVNGQISNGTLKRKRTISVAGYPGYEVEFDMAPSSDVPSGAAVLSRIVWASPRLYQVMVLGAKPDGLPSDASRVVQSFKILE